MPAITILNTDKCTRLCFWFEKFAFCVNISKINKLNLTQRGHNGYKKGCKKNWVKTKRYF